MVNDVVADFLTRIRNAGLRSQESVSLQTSKMIAAIAEILKQEGYIEELKIAEKELTVTLKYVNKKPAIMHLEKVSKPGVRIYVGYQDIPRVLNGLGINIFSTSKGIKTGKQARKEKLGGEYICNIW